MLNWKHYYVRPLSQHPLLVPVEVLVEDAEDVVVVVVVPAEVVAEGMATTAAVEEAATEAVQMDPRT